MLQDQSDRMDLPLPKLGTVLLRTLSHPLNAAKLSSYICSCDIRVPIYYQEV
jgi:hypothetical protein